MESLVRKACLSPRFKYTLVRKRSADIGQDREGKIHQAGKTVRFTDFSLPILWIRKVRDRTVTQPAGGAARTRPEPAASYPIPTSLGLEPEKE